MSDPQRATPKGPLPPLPKGPTLEEWQRLSPARQARLESELAAAATAPVDALLLDG